MVFSAGVAPASETAERFLERLRELGHDDLIVEYLERAAEDPLVSQEFQQRARFELIAAGVDRAIAETDADQRAEGLRRVETELAAVEPKSSVAKRAVADARARLALAYADDARRQAIKATQADSRKGAEDARKAIEAARGRLAETIDAFVAERETLKDAQAESEEWRRRRDLGGRLGQARLVAARLLHELAMTHPADSKPRERLNRDAAKQLGELYEKYSRWVVGLYAHLYEGRCYRLLGEDRLALACFEDLTAQPAKTPELRQVVTLAHAEIAALRVGAGEPEKALEAPEKWLEGLDRADRNSAQAATLAYWVGEAAAAAADSADRDDKKRLLKQAKERLGASARVATEVQADARRAWARVNGQLGADAANPQSFEEAYQAGKEALATLGATRLAAEADDDPGLADQIESSRELARVSFQAAVRLADEKTDPQQLNETRYLLAWLLWEAGDDLEAAKLAGAVAGRSPDDPIAESAAQLALAALQRIERESDDARLVEAAGERLAKLASFTAEKWPDGDAAQAALQVLLSSALGAGDLDEARRVLKSVGEAQRPTLGLQFALARFEKATRENPDDRDGLRGEVRKAYDAARDAGASQRLLATATLYLAQGALDEGDAAKALRLLDADGHGAGRAAATGAADDPFRQQALVTLTRAVAGANAGRRVDDTLRALDETTAALDEGTSRRLLLTIGSGLRADLRAAADGKRSGTRVRVTDEVLDRVEGATNDADWNTMLWIAQTRLELSDAAGDSPAGREQLEAASAAFGALVERAEADAGFAPSPTAVLAARLQLAQCDRRLGKRREALDAFRKLLAERPAMLDVQVAAAETLQEWGAESGSPDKIEASIAGDYPDTKGRNAVWGWAKIASVAGRGLATNPKLEETFFKAWLNVAKSRYLAGTLVSGAGRDEQFRKAASTIKALRRQHPDLGGEAIAAQFDALLERVDPKAKSGG